MEPPIKSALERHIGEVSQKIEITLETHETTPAVGNCWYEACASLMRLNKMKDISAKQLRKEVVNNIENCANFKHVFEMIFESNYKKFSEFKEKHHREGEFTDEDGVLALATGYYLGVTLRIFSRSNTKLQPYTEHNENQPIIFNIFLDDRNTNSEHFQSLKQPEVEIAKDKNGVCSKTKNVETIRSTEEVMDDFLNVYYNEQEVAMNFNDNKIVNTKETPTNDKMEKNPAISEKRASVTSNNSLLR